MADFHIDEAVTLRIAPLLQAMGHTAITAQALGMKRAKDEEHLLAATQTQRILVTHNWADFFLLHRAWLLWSQAWQVTAPHSGILVMDQQKEHILAQEYRSFCN